MGLDGAMHYFDMVVALLIVDVLLSGDNAMVIALACRALPAEQRRRAMIIGTGGAVLLRILMASVAGLLMRIPLLKIAGGVLLVVIAIKLLLIESDDEAPAATSGADDLWAAVRTVVAADVVMSLDNVVGLAAVAQGEVLMLSLGLLISMPLLMFGSVLMGRLIQRFPLLVSGGAALLGWIAGDIAMSDALIADWVQAQSPGLTVAVPALLAVYVVLQGRIVQRTRPALAPLREQLQRMRPAAPIESDAQAVAPPAIPVPLQPAPMPGPAAETAAVPEPYRTESEDIQELPVGPWRWFRAIKLTLVAGLVVPIGVIVGFVHFWMPQPVQLQQFDCVQPQASVSYRTGVARVRLAVGAAYANGNLRPDQQIEWGDYQAVTRVLGMAPPIRLRLKDPQTLVLDGGGFAQTACVAKTLP